jgi:hypothetical protein
MAIKKGIGATVTKTNRATGKSTTTKKRLTRTTADEFKRGAVSGATASGAGKMKRVAKPLTKKKTTTTRVTKNRKDTMY